MNDQSNCQESSIEKHEVNLEDTSNNIFNQLLNSNEEFIQSDLNCMKFFQTGDSQNVQENENWPQEEQIKQDEKASQLNDANSTNNSNINRFNNLFVCGLIRDVEKIVKLPNKSQDMETLTSESARNSNSFTRSTQRSRSNSFNGLPHNNNTSHILNNPFTSQIEQQRQGAHSVASGKNKEFFQMFTTQIPSEYLFHSKDQISANMVKALLKEKEDVEGFIQTFNTSFTVQNQKKNNLRAFQFDLCFNENQGHSIISQDDKILNWLLERKNSTDHFSSNYSNLDNEPNHFVLIFGQQNVRKSDLVNILEKDSLISTFLKSFNETIRFFKVQLFYQDREYIMIQKTFTQQGQGKRELGMELRQALRNRDSLVKKIAQSLGRSGHSAFQEIRNNSHLGIQINHYIFLDLAGIEGLNQSDNNMQVSSLTNNFSSMTNEILKLSPYYKNHTFQTTKDQENSMFHVYLKSNLHKDSKVMIICCISPLRELQAQSIIALDYCQKIKCYFNGTSDEEILSKSFSLSETTQSNGIQEKFTELSQFFSTVSRVKKQVDKAFKNLTDGRDTSVKTSQLFDQLERVKSKLLQIVNENYDSLTEVSKTSLQRMQQQLVYDIESVQVQIQTLQEMTNADGTRKKSGSRTRIHKKTNQQSLTRIRSQSQNKMKISNVSTNMNDQSKVNSNQKPIQRRMRGFNSENKENGSHSTPKLQSNKKQSLIRKKSSEKKITLPPAQVINTKPSKQTTKKNSYRKPSQQNTNQKQILESPRPFTYIQNKDKDDTPQFLEETYQKSSIYARTSFNMTSPGKNALNSQYSSINNPGGSIYVNSEMSAGENRPMKLEENFSRITEEKSIYSVQDKLQEAQRENEYLNQERMVQQKIINSLQEKLQSVSDKSQQSIVSSQREIKKVEDLENKLRDKSKMIESLEYQNKCLKKNNTTSNTINSSKHSTDRSPKQNPQIKELQKQIQQKNQEIDDLRREKDESQDINRQIIQQISMMKSLVEEFKDREQQNQELILKVERREKKIKKLQDELKNLTQKLQQYYDTQTSKDSQAENTNKQLSYKVKEQEQAILKLKEELSFVSKQQSQRVSEIQDKSEKALTDYKKVVEENQCLKDQLEKKDVSIRQLEKAKENYKDQVMDLKADLKSLKGRINENEENLHHMKHEVQQKNKSMVLTDIKNMIKDYRHDKSIQNQSQY